MASFKVDLWDKYTDITEKIKVGKNALKNLESYLKTYVEVQEKLGKTLSKEKFDSKNQGQLIDSLEGTNVFNVDIGRKIVSITTDIEKVMLKDLAVLRKEITKTVKDANKEEKKLRADLGSAESSAKSAKSTDLKEKKAYEKLLAELAKATADSTYPPKKLQALQKSVAAGDKSQAKAEQEYKVSVERLHAMDSKYYSELGEVMFRLEELEKKRIRSMKSAMEKFAAYQQEIATEYKRLGDILQQTYSQIDEEKDIQEFIGRTKSGERPPAPAQFEPYIVQGATGGGSTYESSPSLGSFRNSTPPKSASASPSMSNITATTTNTPLLKKVKVLYDYTSDNVDELKISAGEILEVYELNDDGWYVGKNSRGQKGLFPSNFVEDYTGATAAPTTVTPVPAPTATAHDNSLGTTTALYPYEAQDPSELSFGEGDVITIYEKNEDGWWYGGIKDRKGLFPMNYTEAGAQ